MMISVFIKYLPACRFQLFLRRTYGNLIAEIRHNAQIMSYKNY